MNRSIIIASLVAASGQTYAANLVDFGYTLNGKNQVVDGKFAEAIKNAKQLSKDDQGCLYASRATIYAFDDATIYVSNDNASFNAFENKALMARGCYIPNQL